MVIVPRFLRYTTLWHVESRDIIFITIGHDRLSPKEGLINMPHIFSVEIHAYLSAKIEQAEEKKKLAVADRVESQLRHLKGELLELVKMREYLTDNIDLKTQKYF